MPGEDNKPWPDTGEARPMTEHERAVRDKLQGMQREDQEAKLAPAERQHYMRDEAMKDTEPAIGTGLAVTLENAIKLSGERMLPFFRFSHLSKPTLRECSEQFAKLALEIVDRVPMNAERTVALRKLLEAKDCAVRALLTIVLLVLTAAGAAAQVDQVDASRVILGSSDTPAITNRALTSSITALSLTEHGVIVDFTKKTGAGRWPDVVPPGWTGPIQYTVWIGMNISGGWQLCPVLEFWFGRGLDADVDAGNNPLFDAQVARNWTYFCGQMARQPVAGEPIAFMVSAGDQRRMDVFGVRERSNIVIVNWPAAVPSTTTFNQAPTPVPTPTPQPTPDPGGHHSADDERLDALTREVGELRRELVQVHQTVDNVAVLEQRELEAIGELKQFTQDARGIWKSFGEPFTKFVLPALAAFFAGFATK